MFQTALKEWGNFLMLLFYSICSPTDKRSIGLLIVLSRHLFYKIYNFLAQGSFVYSHRDHWISERKRVMVQPVLKVPIRRFFCYHRSFCKASQTLIISLLHYYFQFCYLQRINKLVFVFQIHCPGELLGYHMTAFYQVQKLGPNEVILLALDT